MKVLDEEPSFLRLQIAEIDLKSNGKSYYSKLHIKIVCKLIEIKLLFTIMEYLSILN